MIATYGLNYGMSTLRSPLAYQIQ